MNGVATAPGAGTVLNALATGQGSAFAIDVETTATVELAADAETVTVESAALFTEPLPGFNRPPANTGQLDPNLYEDVSGDGDGLDPSQTVDLWTQLVVNPDAFNDLTQDQVDALDWNGDGQLSPADAVELWTEQVLAS